MFLPIFYPAGRLAVNQGRLNLERGRFAVLLATRAYTPSDDDATLEDVVAFEASGDGYVAGGVPLPPMKVEQRPEGIFWGAGTPPTVFERVTIEDFAWAVGYHGGGGELVFYARLGEQSVSAVDVSLAWHEQGIGLERVKGV